MNPDVATAIRFAVEQRHPELRAGQHAFNVFHALYPVVANEIRATTLDPFYEDSRLGVFYTWLRQKFPPSDDPRPAPILVLDEDGDFRVDWAGKTGPKNILWGEWAESIESGRFYLIAVPGSIDSNIDLTTTT